MSIVVYMRMFVTYKKKNRVWIKIN